MYGIGLRADRIHAQRAQRGPDQQEGLAAARPLPISTHSGKSGTVALRVSAQRGVLHAQRAVTEPGAVEGGRATPDGVGSSVGARAASGSVTASRGLYMRHSAGYWHWRYRVKVKQEANARRYARKLERIIRATRIKQRFNAPTRTLSHSGGYQGVTSIRYAVAWCESGGDPYNTHNPKYRGKWQFDQPTWDAFAPAAWRGHDPATVPESVQDAVAMSVTFDAWPNC